MDITEVRQKYPQYSDLSDEQLLTGLHTKFYSDIPKDQFMAKFETQPVEQPAAEPSMWDQVKRQAGRTARMGAEAVGAMPLLAADFGVNLRNMIENPPENVQELMFGKPGGYELPSRTYQRGLDELGLPRAEGLVEKGVDIAGQMALGSKTMPNIGVRTPAPAGFAPPSTAAKDVIAEGAKRGVPVYYDDLGGVVAKKLGTAAESVPIVGTAGGRAAQSQAVTKAVGKVVDDLRIGDDVPDMVQKGMQNRLGSLRKTAGKLYTEVANRLDPKGVMPTNSFDDAILKAMEAQQKLGTAAKPEVTAILEKYASAPRGDFSLMRELRSQLGSEISDFYKGGSAIGEKGVGAIQSIKRALESDMGSFADEAGGAAKAAWRKADAFYRTGIAPLKETGLRQLVKSPEPEKAWRWLVSGDTPSRSARMYRALDGEGRAAVRYGLVKDAMEKATNPKGDISPARFARYLEDHQNAITTFFKGKDLREIQGFQNLMRHVERAGQYAENPPTGNRLVPFLLGGAAYASPGTAATVGGTAGAIKLMFQTKAGRDALLSMSEYKPGSKEAENVSKYIAGLIATQGAKE